MVGGRQEKEGLGNHKALQTCVKLSDNKFNE